MENAERESYEEQLRDKDEQIETLMEQLTDAINLLKEVRYLTKDL